MERILLLEDDKSLVTGLTLALGRAGYALDTARTLAEAGHLWQAGRYDLLMLDVTLPDGTGFDFCREVRRTSGVPILFLTASDEEMDIITGLDLGGDDYITKPFKLGVLLSRVHALLRRAGGFGAQQATELCSGGIRVDLLAGRAEKNGVPLELTAAEYKLLCLFLRSPGQVLTKETILNALWDCEGNYVDTNTLTVYIRRLRLKVEDDPGSPQRLVTVRGMGYRWNGDVWDEISGGGRCPAAVCPVVHRAGCGPAGGRMRVVGTVPGTVPAAAGAVCPSGGRGAGQCRCLFCPTAETAGGSGCAGACPAGRGRHCPAGQRP